MLPHTLYSVLYMSVYWYKKVSGMTAQSQSFCSLGHQDGSDSRGWWQIQMTRMNETPTARRSRPRPKGPRRAHESQRVGTASVSLRSAAAAAASAGRRQGLAPPAGPDRDARTVALSEGSSVGRLPRCRGPGRTVPQHLASFLFETRASAARGTLLGSRDRTR